MNYLDFIERDAKIYHIVNGWGIVTAGEYGSDFQVKFPNIKQVLSFRANGYDYEGINKVIYKDEASVGKDTHQSNTEPLYGLKATILKNGSVDISFDGVNNSEIMQVIEALLEVVIEKEVSKGNTKDGLCGLVDSLASNMRVMVDREVAK